MSDSVPHGYNATPRKSVRRGRELFVDKSYQSGVCNRSAVVDGGVAVCPHIVACGANVGLLKL